MVALSVALTAWRQAVYWGFSMAAMTVAWWEMMKVVKWAKKKVENSAVESAMKLAVMMEL